MNDICFRSYSRVRIYESAFIEFISQHKIDKFYLFFMADCYDIGMHIFINCLIFIASKHEECFTIGNVIRSKHTSRIGIIKKKTIPHVFWRGVQLLRF